MLLAAVVGLSPSTRCSPTTTTSRSQQRSLPSRLLLDTRRVLWIERHLKWTCSRQGQTDRVLLQSDSRLSVINRQDKIQGTQTHTLKNTVFTLANTCNLYLDDSWACTMHISHIIHMRTSRNLPVFSFFSCLLATVICLLSRVVPNIYCLCSPIGISDEQLKQGGRDLHLGRGGVQQARGAHHAAAGEPGQFGS